MTQASVGQLLHGLTVGGAEVMASRIACGLRDRFRFVFLCLDERGELGERLQRDGFCVRVLGRAEGIDWRCAGRLATAVRDENIQLLHAHQYTPFFYAMAARLRGASVPIVFTEHGRFHPDLPSRKRMIFNRMMLQKRDRVVAVGEAVRRALIHNEGIPERRVEVIYNGIDLAPYKQTSDKQQRSVTRRELNVDPNAFVLIQVARLDYLKDHLTAVRMMKRLTARCQQARLLMVGEGPERAKIEAEVAALGLDRYVRLLGTRHDVPRLLGASDVCLLTSISEGIPLTLIEAMAAELPVVSTDVGGVREVVDPGGSGILVPSGDHQKLAEAVALLADDPILCRQMGQRGARRAREEFCEQRMHRRYGQIYDQVWQGRPASAVQGVRP